MLGTLGVPAIRADCRSLFTGDHLRCIVFFDAGVPRSHRTLPPTLCFSSLLSQHLGFSSSLSIDPTIRVCLPPAAVTQSPRPIHSSRRPQPHHSSRFALFSPSSIHYRTYPENPTRPIPRAHKSSSTSPSRPPQPYLSTPDPKSEQRGSPRETFLSPLFGCLLRGSFVAWPHRSYLRSPRPASLRHE